MALTKTVVYDRTEVRGDYKTVNCREATVIMEDGVEISRAYHRKCLIPSVCEGNRDGDNEFDGTFTHTDTDISGEPAETQAICNAVWTDAVRAAWKSHEEDIYPG